MVRQSPLRSALGRSMHGDEAAEWDLSAHLLALIGDLLAGANWQRGGDARAPRPKPIPRPGVKGADEVKKFGGKALPEDELRKRLGWDTTPVEHPPEAPSPPLPRTLQEEHDLGIAGHEVDCPICQKHDKHTTRSVLIPQQVREIRAAAGAGETIAALADRFEVSRSTIRAVITRKTWANVN